MAKSLESESASIVVILGGFAVVAASILGAGLVRQSATADTALAVQAVRAVDVPHRDASAADSTLGAPIADRGGDNDNRDSALYYPKDTGARAMQAAIAVGMPSSSEIRLTNAAPGTPVPPKHSEWWWVPAGLGTAGAVAVALRLGLRRRAAESAISPEDISSGIPAH